MTSVDPGLERLVLSYLEKRGYAQTSRQLRSEAASLNRPMTLAPTRDNAGVTSDLLFYLANEGQASQYAMSFDRLVSWVDSSLDKYRHELMQVLYPVFIHCYLYLVKNDATSNAAQLLSRHLQRFNSVGGQPSKMRMQELNELQAATLPDHLTSNRIATAVRGKRMPVKLSSYSYELLLNYLQASKLVLILGIVNDHLQLEVKDGAPMSIEESLKETSFLAESAAAGTSQAQLSEIDLSLLRDLAEDRYAKQLAQQNLAEAQVMEEGLTKKAQASKEKDAQKAVEALDLVMDSRMVSEVPLPATVKGLQEERLEDIAVRATLSSDALPSSIFYTFSGNLKNLNCCATSNDCSIIAGGFEDASVRLFNMQPQPNGDPEDNQSTGDREYVGHTGAVYGVDIAPSHPLLLSASADSTLRLWHTELGACINMYRGHNFPVWDVSSGPFGHYFASAGADRTCRIWSVERNGALRILAGHHSDVETVSWHPNHQYLATGSSDTSIRLWDIRDGSARRILSGHKAPVTALAFHPEGSMLASADDDGQIIVWDLGEAKQLCASSKHSTTVWSLSYSFGKSCVLASGSADNTVNIWHHAEESSSLRDLSTFSTRAAAIHTCFSPRNLLVCAGGQSFRSV